MPKLNILKLPEDCILEIIKYILLDCEINGENIREISVKYIQLVNFIVVDEYFEGTFEYYHENLYKELEFSIVANRLELSIKFYELYERIKHFSEREQDVFWRTYSNSIKQNHRVISVEFIYDPATYWSGYLDAYELCKEALRNKKSVVKLIIGIKGYCIDDLAFLENIEELHLKARTTAAVLVNFCKANPNLRVLKLNTSDIYGRLSDITNFCPNLKELSFHMKAGVDEAEYGPLKMMPKLRNINLISCEDTSPLKILGEMNYLKRSEIQPMELTIHDSSKDLVRTFRVALCDSLQYFNFESEFIEEKCRTITEAKYDICETFQEKSALEASICLDGINFIEFWRQDRILTLRLNVLAIRKLGFLSQLPDLERLEIEAEYLDTIPFENIKELKLQATTINTKALVDFCVSNPDLNELNFINTDWIGNLPDIAPHCPNLQILKFELPSGANIAEFTPLVLQAKLRQLFISVSIVENNTLTSIYNEMKVWNSPRNQPLLVRLHATLLASNICTLGRLDILKSFQCSCDDEDPILVADYDYRNEGRNSSLSEDLEVSISMGDMDVIVFDESRRALYLAPHSEFLEYSDIWKIFPKINCIIADGNPDFLTECVLNFTHLSYLLIDSDEEEDSFFNLFRSLSTTKLINLNALIIIDDDRTLDQFEVAELAKIKSLRLLGCSLLEPDYVEHLSKLTKLQIVEIQVKSCFSASEKGLWDWLAACENIIIIKYYNVEISIYKYKRILKIESSDNFNASDLIGLSALRDIEIVEISGEFLSGSLNKLFEAFSLNSACTVIELDISTLKIEVLEDISNITQIQSIKKLKCSLLKIDGIEELAQLPNIEDLTIETEDPASLVSLFEDLAAKENPAIRYLEINQRNLRPEEVVKMCQLPFLSRLQCSFHNSVDGQYFSALANSNIEELSVVALYPNIFYKNLFAAFSQNTTLKHLTIFPNPLEIEEISEISKMKGLKIFETNVLKFKDVEFLWRNSSIEHLVINELDITSSYLKSPGDTGFKSPVSLKKMVLQTPISFRECQYLIMLESLESLECEFKDTKNINILTDLKNLKVLNIKKEREDEYEDEYEDGEDIRLRESYWELYRDLALKKSSTLKELHAPIRLQEELYEIKKIKSLITLNISYSSNIECLVELTDLETLYISDVRNSENIIPIFRSCKKLSFVQLKFEVTWRPHPDFLREVINILKLIRNPEIQKPLQLTILYDMGENIEMEGIDGSYLEAKLEFLPFDIGNFKNWPSK